MTPRRPLLALALVLALAACAAPSAPPNTAEEACARQADEDPAVRQTLAISAGNLAWQWQHADEINRIRAQAAARCMQSRGLAPRGGVERPR